MITTRALFIGGVLLAALSPARSTAEPAGDSHARHSEQACRQAWHQSEASRSCSLRFMYFFPADFCKLGGDCATPDGGTSPFSETMRLENVPLLRNCGGQLGAHC